VIRSRYESGGETFVAVMQAADLGDGDDSSDPGWHDRAGIGAILVEREMRACVVVIVDVRGEDSAQMALVEDHKVIETFAANQSYYPLTRST
jgi:hypothetical protein